MIYVGIDPDLHDTSVGFWQDGQPIWSDVIHVPKRKGVIRQEAVLEMTAAICKELPGILDGNIIGGIAVEAQTLRRIGMKQHKRPEDIVILGNVAGAILGFCMAHGTMGTRAVFFPTPEEWKGQIPKEVMQARLYSDLGWGYEMAASNSYARPLKIPALGFPGHGSGKWKHVGDALLLARWAANQHK